MKQQSNQRNYMSSKDIYFLPVIKQLKPTHSKKTIKPSHSSIEKFRSIEQIMRNKSIVDPRLQTSVLQVKKSKKTTDCNLYDKYDYLPKIFSLRNGRRNEADRIKNELPKQENKENLSQSKQKDAKWEKKCIENKQNSFNFNSSFYREEFNRKLEFQIGKLQFNIKYSLSHKNMLLGEDAIDNQEISEKKQSLKKKYTRLQTYQKENSKSAEELQKVPSFLLKLIDCKKP